jgi:hypothetical protein
LARRTGLSDIAAIETAIDRMLNEFQAPQGHSAQMMTLLAQIDQIPDRSDARDPLDLDKCGLSV